MLNQLTLASWRCYTASTIEQPMVTRDVSRRHTRYSKPTRTVLDMDTWLYHMTHRRSATLIMSICFCCWYLSLNHGSLWMHISDHKSRRDQGFLANADLSGLLIWNLPSTAYLPIMFNSCEVAVTTACPAERLSLVASHVGLRGIFTQAVGSIIGGTVKQDGCFHLKESVIDYTMVRCLIFQDLPFTC